MSVSPEEFAEIVQAALATAIRAISTEAPVVILSVIATHPESNKVMRTTSHRPSTESMDIMAQAVHEAVHRAVAEVMPEPLDDELVDPN